MANVTPAPKQLNTATAEKVNRLLDAISDLLEQAAKELSEVTVQAPEKQTQPQIKNERELAVYDNASQQRFG